MENVINMHMGYLEFTSPLIDWSREIWKKPKRAYSIALTANVIVFCLFFRKSNLISLIAHFLLLYIIAGIIKVNLLSIGKYKEEK